MMRDLQAARWSWTEEGWLRKTLGAPQPMLPTVHLPWATAWAVKSTQRAGLGETRGRPGHGDCLSAGCSPGQLPPAGEEAGGGEGRVPDPFTPTPPALGSSWERFLLEGFLSRARRKLEALPRQ